MNIKTFLAATAAVLLASATPAAAQSQTLPQKAMSVVADMEAVTGRIIVVLERSDHDLSAFYYKAMTAMCEKTGDNWCEDQVMRLLSDTTNPLGWARVIRYTNDEGVDKTICALLPPKPNVNVAYAATGLTGGIVVGMDNLPDLDEMEAYLWLLHTAGCQSDSGSPIERRRANVFAVMALALVQGDTQFVGAYAPTPARLFVPFRDPTHTRWGVNVAERLLLEHWKAQTADALTQIGCNASMVASTDLNTDYIQRAPSLGTMDCAQEGAGYRSATVTDANLWLWSAQQGQNASVALPPQPYQPFAMFPTRKDGVTYMWQTSLQLAQ